MTDPTTDDLRALDPSPDHLDALRNGLAARAAEERLLDLAYTTVETPVGPLLLAASPAGLVRVAFAREDHDVVLRTLADRVGARILRGDALLTPYSSQVEAYFAGTLHRFDVPLDLRLASGFRRTVLDHLADIAYGRTETYTEVAAATGSPRAVRAVGTACARNPLPVVVPCHRVVRSDGTVGEYVGGAEVKRRLLALEGSAA